MDLVARKAGIDYSSLFSVSGVHKKSPPRFLEEDFVPGTGIEPVRSCNHWCLRPTRLPVPPPGRFTELGSAKVELRLQSRKLYLTFFYS